MRNPIDDLTERQRECLRLVGQGYSTKQIARILGKRPPTIETHIRAVLVRLQLQDRSEAARMLIAREAHHQSLISQLEPLAGPELPEQPEASAGLWWHLWSTMNIPPIGGRENELGTADRVKSIVTTALIFFLGFIVLAMIARVAFGLLSPR